MNKIIYLAGLTLLSVLPAAAQEAVVDSTATLKDQTLSDVTVTARRASVRSLSGAINGKDILRDELFKAACCNLGESFVNNASVDVNYSDATTGAKQIKLLGLSGTYVQMLTENLPNFRGAALPYGLGYVPGSWMKSMQVSKGNTSVKNGYEAMTGQINVEYVKPEDPTGMTVNSMAVQWENSRQMRMVTFISMATRTSVRKSLPTTRTTGDIMMAMETDSKMPQR